MACITEKQNRESLFLIAYNQLADQTTLKARDLLEKGANRNDFPCMMVLSLKYLLGSREYPADREQSDYWHERLVKVVATTSPPKRPIHPLADGFYKKFQVLDETAQKANSKSVKVLFSEEAQRILEKAARYGHIDAIRELAFLYLDEGKIPESTALFEEAATAGDIPSQEMMIEFILDGISAIPENQRWNRYLTGLGFFFKILVTAKCNRLSKPESIEFAEHYEHISIARSIFVDKFAIDYGVSEKQDKAKRAKAVAKK